MHAASAVSTGPTCCAEHVEVSQLVVTHALLPMRAGVVLVLPGAVVPGVHPAAGAVQQVNLSMRSGNPPAGARSYVAAGKKKHGASKHVAAGIQARVLRARRLPAKCTTVALAAALGSTRQHSAALGSARQHTAALGSTRQRSAALGSGSALLLSAPSVTHMAAKPFILASRHSWEVLPGWYAWPWTFHSPS